MRALPVCRWAWCWSTTCNDVYSEARSTGSSNRTTWRADAFRFVIQHTITKQPKLAKLCYANSVNLWGQGLIGLATCLNVCFNLSRINTHSEGQRWTKKTGWKCISYMPCQHCTSGIGCEHVFQWKLAWLKLVVFIETKHPQLKHPKLTEITCFF